MPLEFEWDDSKARSNLQKLGVGFDEASTVFEDPPAAIFPDDDHSIGEVREIAIGSSILGRLVLVSLLSGTIRKSTPNFQRPADDKTRANRL